MHELPITEEIIRIASAKAEAISKTARVKKISLVIGDRSGFVFESIQMYFDVISEGTSCAGAKIEMEGVKTKLKCPACGKTFEKGDCNLAAGKEHRHIGAKTDKNLPNHRCSSPPNIASNWDDIFRCPSCGTLGEPTKEGTEFFVKDIEI
jgi:hydrogenase nickel incorporation protein HypA/HybF